MVNSEIRISQASLSQTPKAQNPNSPTIRSDGNKDISAQGNDRSGLLESTGNPFVFNAISFIKSRLNAVAKDISAADKRLETIENYIDRMKAQLGRIIKNYPPFPPGSEERVRLLKSYISLRKQIDQLTIPPPTDEFSMRDFKVSAFFVESGNWDALKDPVSIHITNLSEDATDEDIDAAMEVLETSKDVILQRREALAGEVGNVGSQEIDAFFSKIFPSYGEDPVDPEIMSVKIGHTLSTKSGMTLSRARSHLLSLLE